MKISLEVKIKPFMVPNFVVEQTPDGGTDGRSIPLSALDPGTLDRLCNEFRDEVFEKAKKSPPPERA